MTRHEKSAAFSRRALLKAGGALVVSIGAPIAFEDVCAAADATAIVTKPALTPDQLSSYMAVNADGTVSIYFGKMDMGQGLSVAIRQMVAEELDVAFKDTADFHRRHRDQRQPRRRVRIDRRAGRRQADAHGRRRGAPGARRDGG